MTTGISIRMATERDAAAVRAIYTPFCESSAVSFEERAPTTDEIAERIRKITAQLPWLVLADEGRVAGYAYASVHRERAAYRWSVDSSVYVSPAFLRSGVGRALYTALFQLLREQGYYKVHAGITWPNAASVGIHEAMGFQFVGVYRAVGFKQGAWHDVAWYQLTLQPQPLDPADPRPISSVLASPQWRDAVSNGLERYRKRS
jgi:phosphinothricin acetyltransferase